MNKPSSQPAGGACQVCVLIPCYNHGATLDAVLKRVALLGLDLDVMIVDDGSDEATRLEIERVSAQGSRVQYLRLPHNQGKGAAVVAGMQCLHQNGYTHAIQVDADGQHQIEDITKLLSLSRQYPGAVISGQPQYDESVPKSRLYGRYVTHFWVWVQTLSFSIKDSMCGFRVYPIVPFIELVQSGQPMGQRMDFDTEVMVRLYWAGTPSLFVLTQVTYPKDGISHFDVWKDNVRISLMHTRLFFGMLPRIPRLLGFNFKRQQFLQQTQKVQKTQKVFHTPKHWAQVPERQGLWGMRVMMWVYRVLGRRLFMLLLYPVVAVFWLTGGRQREASAQYLDRVQRFAKEQNVMLTDRLSTYRHMLRFADAMLDKLASWRGDIHFGRDLIWASDSPLVIEHDAAKGYLFLVSHLGDMEVCRALAQQLKKFKVNALVFNDNALRFKKIMEEHATDASLNILSVQNIGPETILLLKDKLDAGECVAIVGDRIPIEPSSRTGERRVCWSRFLGEVAPFPQGPFILASLLKCPVMLMFALKQKGKLQIYLEAFATPLVLPRASRQQALQEVVDRYAQRLEYYCLRAPLDWFNFFDFWKLPHHHLQGVMPVDENKESDDGSNS